MNYIINTHKSTGAIIILLLIIRIKYDKTMITINQPTSYSVFEIRVSLKTKII